MKTLYTARAEASGGRLGTAKSSDGVIDVKLTIPKAMGGPGTPGATTPEDLFAAGYAACFGSACDFMAKQMKIAVKKVTIIADVAIGSIEGGGFGLGVALDARLEGVSESDANKVVEAAHRICPYSNATRNNIRVDIKVTTL